MYAVQRKTELDGTTMWVDVMVYVMFFEAMQWLHNYLAWGGSLYEISRSRLRIVDLDNPHRHLVHYYPEKDLVRFPSRREQVTRERAYELWEQAGRPVSDGREFWRIAEWEVRSYGEGIEMYEWGVIAWTQAPLLRREKVDWRDGF